MPRSSCLLIPLGLLCLPRPQLFSGLGRRAAQRPLRTALMAGRSFTVRKLGGSALDVTVPPESRLEALLDEVMKAQGVGAMFHLVEEGGKILSDPRAALPEGKELTMVLENPASLPEPAQKVLRENGRGKCVLGDAELLPKRLGPCGEIGSFPTPQWSEDPRMPDFMGYHDFTLGEYKVLELTLIDGEDKRRQLVGVINIGDGDCNSGLWGPVYLRPGFEEVAGIVSFGDTESKWEVTNSSWYTEPVGGLERNKNDLSGGNNAQSTLETHLAHALAVAIWGKEAWEGDDDD